MVTLLLVLVMGSTILFRLIYRFLPDRFNKTLPDDGCLVKRKKKKLEEKAKHSNLTPNFDFKKILE